MIKFLLTRPIAVSMTFLAILLLGCVAIGLLPISLMPDVAIPEISVQISHENRSARQLENTVVKTIRRQLLQVPHLEDIKSVTRDGSSFIHMKMAYGSDINLAYIEVNEKIDKCMSLLPKDMTRPKVIKASATDIPVLKLNLSLQKEQNPQQFMELSQFADAVIRKRIEQLSPVAMVDITGRVFPEISIHPDLEKMKAHQISYTDIENLVHNNNIDFGNLMIRDGHYQYNIHFEKSFQNVNDIKNLYFDVDGKVLKLKDIATVELVEQSRKGLAMMNGKETVSLSIIKQADARIQDMKDELQALISNFHEDYPNIEFEISEDQSKLLDYSIENLKQSLLLGASLAFLVMFFFLKDFRAPWLIGVSIPTSLIISLLFFHLLGLSLNIISLSGLVLGIGMMIDNSIIVIDNISQFRQRGENLLQSCIKGTNEVIRPMLSSVLTTCSVFLPLIFISGIAGALFYDQALAVSIGLFVSLLVSISLLPVYYRLFYKHERQGRLDRWVNQLSKLDYTKLYETGLTKVFRNQKLSWFLFLLLLACAITLVISLPKKRLPELTQHEMILRIDWNDRINIDENRRRTEQLIRQIEQDRVQTSVLIGEQQYLLNRGHELSASESLIYMKVEDSSDINALKKRLKHHLNNYYTECRFYFTSPENLFEQVFADDESPLVARINFRNGNEKEQLIQVKQLQKEFTNAFPGEFNPSQAFQEQVSLEFDPIILMLYKIDINSFYKQLQTAFNHNELDVIRNNQDQVPLVLGDKKSTLYDLINQTKIVNEEGVWYKLNQLVKKQPHESLKSITAGKEGEFVPYALHIDDDQLVSSKNKIKQILSKYKDVDLSFSGSIFANKTLLRQLGLILLISLLLLYFILASQFESFSQPLIVLLEVPIDIGGALLVLWAFGGDLNLMSLIGLIVMSGIIINDSILKIDTINRLRKEKGFGLIKAILVGGQRRLKPILMTSITTILALFPFLFLDGLGAELQKPLAIVVIGGMFIGTLVSLYFVPLCYYYLNRSRK
ncbi:efflux RND transporter permease subunit [Marinifilum caeruleilacunae]|uniref:Efflux RND transporter permease subunit n=1 Tax=Marinifilum caeruleilacunae TaxID=2499076 RepID=A0ABX1X0X1_9BACT|nr:efflux RND transporter permease subunit [Marinifilum caeruleilacunae]NOU62020.1 efflux RND transporter permease subunit [Marinifilum caeruleilacunae]